MKITEYDDKDLLQEVKRRGFEIQILPVTKKLIIGGVVFDIK